jgi:4-amino-4-deoxy-L-arabinose transferase-like glycosyltransferase
MSVTRTLVLTLLFAILWFGQLDYRRLIHADEGRYAEISREMVVSGDWITPHLNGVKYFYKPPMQYWATATAFSLWGPNEWTSRLWTALTGFLGVLLVGFTAARLYGREAGIASAAVLGSSALYVGLGHVNALDMGLTFFLTGAMCGFLLAQHAPYRPDLQRNWLWFAWAMMAGAVLSKGLVGIVLPGIALVGYTLLTRNGWVWLRLRWFSGLLILLAITAPWFVLVMQRNPEFGQFFFIHEHFERFLTTVHNRSEPWWYFLPILLVGSVPWVAPMLLVIATRWRHEQTQGFQTQVFLWAWAIGLLLFFSKSHSKLPGYIGPMLPALALLIGPALLKASTRTARWLLGSNLLGVFLIAGFAVALRQRQDEDIPAHLFVEYSHWVTSAAVCLLIGTLASWWQVHRQQRLHAIVSLAGAGLVAISLLLCGHNTMQRYYSAHELAQIARQHLQPASVVYSVGAYQQTFPFYLGRTTLMVGYQGELAFGIQQAPARFIPTLPAFVQHWQQAPHAIALITPHDYAMLQGMDFPHQVLAHHSRYYLVQKTPRNPNP